MGTEEEVKWEKEGKGMRRVEYWVGGLAIGGRVGRGRKRMESRRMGRRITLEKWERIQCWRGLGEGKYDW